MMWVKVRGVYVVVMVLVGLLSVRTQPAGAEVIALRLVPNSGSAAVGETITLQVLIDGAVNLGAFEFHLGYDPQVLQPQSAILGPFLTTTGRTPVPLGPAIKGDEIRFAGASYGEIAGPDGSGELATVTFRVVGPGSSPLTFRRVIVTDVRAAVQPAVGLDGLFVAGIDAVSSTRLPLLQR